jgi:hypothetical protein
MYDATDAMLLLSRVLVLLLQLLLLQPLLLLLFPKHNIHRPAVKPLTNLLSNCPGFRCGVHSHPFLCSPALQTLSRTAVEGQPPRIS